MAERCVARGQDISSAVQYAQRVAAAPFAEGPAKIEAATLLVLLDIRTLMDKLDTRIQESLDGSRAT
jgi:hypothetical protein